MLFEAVNGMGRLMVWRGTFIAALVIIMALSLSPVDGQAWFPGQDKLAHSIIFSVLFLLAVKAFPVLVERASSYWKISFGLILYGVLMECLQAQTGYRTLELLDLVADIVGLLLGYLCLRILMYWRLF